MVTYRRGIYAALSEQACETVIAACKAAKKYGTIVSYDLNYRPSMWEAIGGLAKAQEVNKEVAKYVDVMIGNEEDFTACLGFEIEGNDENLKTLNLDGYKKMINEAAATYPNFKAVATTLRQVKTATVNDWSAICWADGEIYKAAQYDGLEIMDRVGGGDSFASGLVYGLMTFEDAEKAVNYGAAHGALAMTTPGDTTMASLAVLILITALCSPAASGCCSFTLVIAFPGSTISDLYIVSPVSDKTISNVK